MNLRDARRWHYRRSLASRVALLTTVAVGVAIAFMAVSAFVVIRMQLTSSLDDSLLNRAHQAAQRTALSEMARRDVPSWMLGAADVRIAFIDLTGPEPEVNSADDGPELSLGSPEVAVAAGRSPESVRTVSAEGGIRYRVATVPADPGQALVLAQPLASQEHTLARLGTVMLVFGLLGVLAAAFAGWLVATNGLRPVRRLTRSVERIARTEDLAALPVEGDDEVARLAKAFNQMLAALAASRDRQRRLVADAGHELRTPLTSLRTNLDLLRQAELGGGLPEGAREELLDDVRAQTEELSTLVGDLVELAREDQPTQVIEDVDLAEVTSRALARVRRRASAADFEATLEPWHLEGDATALERAITNLLDNAAKWSPAGTTITVTLRGGVLTVDDEGAGIDEADRPHVFDRFWRAEESRSMPGSGLGLAIVRQVADRHAGTVSVAESPSGGARLTLALPGGVAAER